MGEMLNSLLLNSTKIYQYWTFNSTGYLTKLIIEQNCLWNLKTLEKHLYQLDLQQIEGFKEFDGLPKTKLIILVSNHTKTFTRKIIGNQLVNQYC